MNKEINMGIYEIKNLVNGKYYVGQSNNLKNRWSNHKSTYKRKFGEHPALHNAFKKYGIDNFQFGVLMRLNDEKLLKPFERWFIEHKQSWRKGYNCDSGGLGGNPNGMALKLYDCNFNFIADLDTAGYVARTNGLNKNMIRRAVRLGRKYKGYFWCDDNNDIVNQKKKYKKFLKKNYKRPRKARIEPVKIKIISVGSGKVLRMYDTLKDAAKTGLISFYTLRDNRYSYGIWGKNSKFRWIKIK